MLKLAIAAFTEQGRSLQQKLIGKLQAEYCVYSPAKKALKAWTKECFASCNGLIFIGATGIAIRQIAPYLQSKSLDPAVVVIDEQGNYAISLLSGHLGKANDLTLAIAKSLGAQPVITTATDIQKRFAVDSWSLSQNCAIADIKQIKQISARILADEPVGFLNDFSMQGELPKGVVASTSTEAGIYISIKQGLVPFAQTLQLVPKIIALGIGCRKNTTLAALEELVFSTLKKENIHPAAVGKVASIDLKSSEKGLLELAKKYKWHFETYSKEELAVLAGHYTDSAFVSSVTGVGNVCERSAVRASSGKLILQKTKGNGITIAIAQAYWKCEF